MLPAKMKRKNLLKYLKYLTLTSIVVCLLLIFIPRTYDMPKANSRQGTQYWELTTGSKIGYFHISGKGTKKPFPIIYLQGGPGGFISDYNIKTFTSLSDDGYDIYLYDQIGSGQSARLSDISEYTTDRHKQDLEEIIKIIGSEKVILIGQSWGAVLATLFIADNTNRVEKIIFTGVPSIQPMRIEYLDIKAPDSLHLKKSPYSNREANEKTQNIRSGAASICARAFGLKLAPDHEVDDFQTYRNQELNKATVCDTLKALDAEGGGGFYAQVMTVKSFSEIKDPRTKLRNCKTPVLIMRGQCDSQPWGFVIEYVELFPNHTLKIIPDAGHSIAVEQSEIYMNTIRNFLHQ
jgi:proline iminopeptidase